MTRNDAQELYEHRNDPDEWGEEAEPIIVKPVRSQVVSFRLPVAELARLEEAVKQTGESLSEYVRKAIVMRLTGGGGRTEVRVVASGHAVMATFRGSAQPEYPGYLTDEDLFPPSTVNIVVGGAQVSGEAVSAGR